MKLNRSQGQIGFAIVLFLSSCAQVFAVAVGPPVHVSSISSGSLDEVSGIVEGRAISNVFWVHNDSGDLARFFAINHQGTLLGTFPLTGASAVDWEDIAIGANPSGGNYLYLGDIGDNDSNRSSITVYRTAEPVTTTSANIPASNYTSAKLQYPDGPRNAESLLVDPLTNDLYLITKSSSPKIYSTSSNAFAHSMTTLTSHGSLGTLISTPTAADISPDGRHILVRSKTAGLLFERAIGQSVADALHGVGIPFTLGVESQGEAIGWASNGSGFFTTSEFDGNSSAPIHSYTFTSFQPGDFDEDGDVDGADFLTWQRNPNVWALNDWQLNYGPGGIPTSVTSTFVPEPSSWLGLFTAFLMIFHGRQRK